MCSVRECPRPFKAKGYCLRHYHRWRRYGDPLAGLPPRDFTPEDRFRATGWSVTDSGCHEWNGSRLPRGYGQFSVGGREFYAHRFAYTLVHGAIAPGAFVLHRCDNPPCVNVAHLFTGTVQDNADDMRSKFREASGERAGQCRLRDDEVSEIRARYAAGGITQRDLAREFSTTQTNVSAIVCRRNRRRVTNYNVSRI